MSNPISVRTPAVPAGARLELSGIANPSSSGSKGETYKQRIYLSQPKTGTIRACPRLRLPQGTIVLIVGVITPASPILVPLSQCPVNVHVMEGGGGFPDPQNTGSWPLQTRIDLRSDIDGMVTIPDFVLGGIEGPNRLLIQSDHAYITVTIQGTFENTQISCANPKIDGVCHYSNSWTIPSPNLSFEVNLQDSGYPSAPIMKMPLAVEIVGGGGWISLSNSSLGGRC